MSSNAPFAKRDQPILIAKVGKLKSNNDESEDSGDGHDESPAKNTLLYGNRVFIIRDELDPVKLETGKFNSFTFLPYRNSLFNL